MTASRDLCIMACTFCRDPAFHAWLESMLAALPGPPINEAGAKAYILHVCGVASRSDLDTDPAAARRFHQFVREPFIAHKRAALAAAVPDWIPQ